MAKVNKHNFKWARKVASKILWLERGLEMGIFFREDYALTKLTELEGSLKENCPFSLIEAATNCPRFSCAVYSLDLIWKGKRIIKDYSIENIDSIVASPCPDFSAINAA